MVLLVCALLGLGSLWYCGTAPRAQRFVGAAVAWFGFWYGLRLLLVCGIWRRETALGPGRKLWLGVTVPIWGLWLVWVGRGRLSTWLSDDQGANDG